MTMERFEEQLHRAKRLGVFDADRKAALRAELAARLRGEAALERPLAARRRWLFRPAALVAGTLVIFLVSGTSFAAEAALPGSPLYPVKVNVNEEVRAALALTPEAKADWDITRAERRLEEAAILESQDKVIPPAAETELEDHFTAHVADAETHIVQASESGADERAADIASRLEAVLAAQHRQLARADEIQATPRFAAPPQPTPSGGENAAPTLMMAAQPQTDEMTATGTADTEAAASGTLAAESSTVNESAAAPSKRSFSFAQRIGSASRSITELRQSIEGRIAEQQKSKNDPSADERLARSAQDKIEAIRKSLEEVRSYVAAHQDELPANVLADAAQGFAAAEAALTHAQEQYDGQSYGDAFNLGNEAFRSVEQVRIAAEYAVRFGNDRRNTHSSGDAKPEKDAEQGDATDTPQGAGAAPEQPAFPAPVASSSIPAVPHDWKEGVPQPVPSTDGEPEATSSPKNEDDHGSDAGPASMRSQFRER
jgi:hypothetical protein